LIEHVSIVPKSWANGHTWRSCYSSYYCCSCSHCSGSCSTNSAWHCCSWYL